MLGFKNNEQNIYWAKNSLMLQGFDAQDGFEWDGWIPNTIGLSRLFLVINSSVNFLIYILKNRIHRISI